MNNIVFKKVSVFYQVKKDYINALDEVDVVFENGKTSVIIGPTGSGKTTLIKCLTAQLMYQGDIFLGDKNLEEIKVKDRNFSYVNQDISLYPKMIVYDNIAFPLKNLKISRDEMDSKVKEIAKKFGIALLLTRKVTELSLGQQQKVALAKALIKCPEFLLLDEPFSNLDNESKENIIEHLKTYLSETKTSVILVTHDLNECFKFADFIYPLVDNKIIGAFTKESIRDCKNKEIQQMLKSGLL